MSLNKASTESLQQAAALTYAVDIVNVTKEFRHKTENKGGYKTVKSFLLSPFAKHETTAEKKGTPALESVTARIPQGVSFGIIGRNGSGKSTLLKLITGIYKPTLGSINVNGRIAALIELGAGFHPDFTGRENVFLGGAVYGLSRDQIKARFSKIVDFAELHDVIDEPVRTYSSGMFMRLGFSLAVHTEPDILIIDEVLSVGDASFVTKCEDRIAALKNKGTTLIVVSHDLRAVEQWCDEALWLDRGVVKDRGNPRRVIDHYREFIEKGEEALLSQVEEEGAVEAGVQAEATRWGSREIEITEVRMLSGDGLEKHVFHPNEKVIVECDYVVRQPTENVVFGVGVNRHDGLLVFGTNTEIDQVKVPDVKDNGTVRCLIDRVLMVEGGYSLDVAVHAKDGYPYDYHRGIKQFSVRSSLQHVGVFNPPHRWDMTGMA
jgi:lipopolysaccharide transport system ATP-binding protein